MEENKSSLDKTGKNFWDTTLGIIAKITALIIAISGLIVAVQPFFKPKENDRQEFKEVATLQENPFVLLDGKLGSGLNMGINTSEGITNWARMNGNELCMSYPDKQFWGAVFITVGKPTQPPRPSKDFSRYRSLVLELKGEKGGETILIGFKDNQDPDDGSEAKLRLTLTKDWTQYPINDLAQNFPTAEFKNLYIVTEFVFEDKPQTICARKIQFLK